MQDHRSKREGRHWLWGTRTRKSELCVPRCGLREPVTHHFNLEVAGRAESLESTEAGLLTLHERAVLDLGRKLRQATSSQDRRSRKGSRLQHACREQD